MIVGSSVKDGERKGEFCKFGDLAAGLRRIVWQHPLQGPGTAIVGHARRAGIVEGAAMLSVWRREAVVLLCVNREARLVGLEYYSLVFGGTGVRGLGSRHGGVCSVS